MSKSNLSWILTPLFVAIFIFLGFKTPIANAAANHLVISQIQVSGTIAADEFVELYNPTNSDIDLSKWKILKENPTNTNFQYLNSSMSGTIKSRGYFLLTSQVSSASEGADLVYTNASATITDNNTVVLQNSNGNVIDRVGMGTAVDNEASNTAQPSEGKSIQRKIDDTGGHGLDTDNNSADFDAPSASAPRNSSVVISPTPTNTPTPTLTPTATLTPTDEPSPTNSPTPTLIPTMTPTPTDTPTPTLTPSPTPSETPIPTLEPTNSPTPTNDPTPTPTTEPTAIPTSIISVTPTASITPTLAVTPTATITPTPIPGGSIFPMLKLQCSNIYFNIQVGFIKMKMPFLTCRLVTI